MCCRGRGAQGGWDQEAVLGGGQQLQAGVTRASGGCKLYHLRLSAMIHLATMRVMRRQVSGMLCGMDGCAGIRHGHVSTWVTSGAWYANRLLLQLPPRCSSADLKEACMVNLHTPSSSQQQAPTLKTRRQYHHRCHIQMHVLLMRVLGARCVAACCTAAAHPSCDLVCCPAHSRRGSSRRTSSSSAIVSSWQAFMVFTCSPSSSRMFTNTETVQESTG